MAGKPGFGVRKTFKPFPTPALSGEQSKQILPGHGKTGYVRLSVEVPPEMKSALIERATKNGRWLIDEVREALSKHLNGAA